MTITFKTRDNWAILKVEESNTKIEQDISIPVPYGYAVPQGYIEDFISIARDMHWFNKPHDDIGFVKKIVEMFLNDSEKQQLIEELGGKA